ncbi:phage terminase small subunit [Vibrio kyushuensis]|uniref:phage terminase small subunit n=1 Tax=Vibrio TaxID=662 RepID=UPI003D119A45
MGSPLKRQRDAILLRVARNEPTADQSDAASPVLAASADSLHIALVEFEQDKLALKEFDSRAQKIEHKRSVLIPKYQPMVEAYLEADETYQNPMFSDLIVWLFDVEELGLAIDWCVTAIEKGIPTPDNFKRKWPEVCADAVLEWAEQTQSSGNSVEPYFSDVLEKIESTWVVNEKLHAKWLKFAGYALITNEEGDVKASHVGEVETLQKAQALLIKAENKNPKAGVGTKLKDIKARIRALEEGTNL